MITSIHGSELVVIRLQAQLFRTHSRSIMYKIMTGVAAIATSFGTKISLMLYGKTMRLH